MDRSRRQGTNGARPATAPPASSRLTVRKHKNRRRPGSVWSRLPKPGAIADACGRAVRRSLPAAAALAVLGAVGGGVWAGHRWLTTSPRFAITEITVQGTHHVDPEALRAALPVRAGDNVFVGLDGVARAARDNPWIAGAEVHRILPHTIAIEVREHTAAAVVELGELYLVDASGRPFKRAALETGEGDGLPIVTGIGRAAYTADPEAAAATVRGAIAAFDGWNRAARPAIGEVHVDAHGAVTLHTYDQAIAIQLGALGAELGGRMHTFDAAWAGLSDAERARARAIHLDARLDHATVAFAKD
jgi:cell division septal protein FtsQ